MPGSAERLVSAARSPSSPASARGQLAAATSAHSYTCRPVARSAALDYAGAVIAVGGFETARMRAEPIGPQHRDGLVALLGDPRVGATLSGIADPDAVDAQICRMTARWERDGFGLYAFLDRDTGALR